MGGLGSGNFEDRYGRKQTVEESWSLDVNELASGGLLATGAEGILHWLELGTAKDAASVSFATFLSDGGERIFRLSYRWDNSEDTCIPIRLQTTKPYFGGVRFWFTCPLINEQGDACSRRVAKLYLPSGERYFGCRVCHNLTYRSCREAGEWERSTRQLERLKAHLAKHRALAKL